MYMARIARKDTEAKYFHVMVQGIGKEFIFFDGECKGYYIHSIQKAQEGDKVKLIGFCVMGNHAHLLLVTDKITDLSLFMGRVNAEYAKYYNRRAKRVGYVFRDRFKSEAIKDEKQLVVCLAYIQNNPVKAGLIETAENYQYSSYTNYLSGIGIVDFDEVAKHFNIAARNMRRIMAERVDEKWLEHDDRALEDAEKVLEELLVQYRIESRAQLKNETLLRRLVLDMQKRSAVSL